MYNVNVVLMLIKYLLFGDFVNAFWYLESLIVNFTEHMASCVKYITCI